MKELTYNDWLKNPNPRTMWVWDSNENTKKQRKVIYFLDPKLTFPVVALSDNEVATENFKYCAEIEKSRRMSNKELARWLREHPSREYKYCSCSYASCSVYSYYTYVENLEDEEINKDIVIREDDGEWKEPLIEVTDD